MILRFLGFGHSTPIVSNNSTFSGAEARYFLGVSSNLFSTLLPEGIYYPDFTALEDHRPTEFISLFDQVRNKPWSKCTILDLGCGEGTSTVAIGKTGAHVIGIEGRPEVVERAKHLRDRLGYTNVEFRVASVLDQTAWEQADAIFASGLIHHLHTPFDLMELIGRFCGNFVYFCTHLAPKNEAQRAASFFAQLLCKEETIAFRDRHLKGAYFIEGDSALETQGQRRRHPRAGIGNTQSWWPTEESFVDVMKNVGFPSWRRLAGNDYRLRYRLCFQRSGEIPASVGSASNFFWNSPAHSSQESALNRSLAADIAFLKRHKISPCIIGDPSAIIRMHPQLLEENITPSAIYLPEAVDQSLLSSLWPSITQPTLRPLSQLTVDNPQFAIIATDNYKTLKTYIGDLITLKSCNYAFCSFSLKQIKEFPPLTDPVTGDTVEQIFDFPIKY